MSLESQIAALVDSTNQLTQTVASKMDAINTLVATKIADMEAWKATLVNQLPMMALNYNNDFMDLAGTAPQRLPVGLVVNADGAFWNRFSVEILPVTGGLAASRDAEASALLDFMGIGRDIPFFGDPFNIMKITRKDAAKISSYAFYIPARKVIYGNGASVVGYAKRVGRTTWNPVGVETGAWRQFRLAWPANSGHVGQYMMFDVHAGEGDAGDTLYLALPTIVPGLWPENRKLGVIPNLINEVKRGYPSLN